MNLHVQFVNTHIDWGVAKDAFTAPNDAKASFRPRPAHPANRSRACQPACP